MSKPSVLAPILAALTPAEGNALTSWIGAQGDPDPRLLSVHHEPVQPPSREPREADPGAIRTVGVIGGGTAGYLAALALRAWRPSIEVTVVESSTIPVIGVGEATVTDMLPFLHRYLGIEISRFYQEVQPTWKLGIKFDWGPNPGGFLAPFDWASHSVGMLGALAQHGSVDGFTLQSLLMNADRTPVLRADDQVVSLLPYLPFAYHLENKKFIGFLSDLAVARGVRHVDATIAEVKLKDAEWVDSLLASDGRELKYDLYIDCTGFRSRLLGQALGVPFREFSASLFTDAAVTASIANHGEPRPYTTASTMNSGWCWNIPLAEGEDHLGYVHSSAAITADQATQELLERHPDARIQGHVQFRSGRRDRLWCGNVVAVGNSGGFVEPLESSGLAMITITIMTLLTALPASWSEPCPRDAVNRFLGLYWDGLRWFLSIHYKFNARLDTQFWKHARADTDVSGIQPLLDAFAAGAPLLRRDALTQVMLQATAPPVYGLAGIDNILLGQGVPTTLLESGEPPVRWRARHDAAAALVRLALPQHEARAEIARHPEFLLEQLTADGGWLGRRMAG
jgi:tryptophan 7-halogenase